MASSSLFEEDFGSSSSSSDVEREQLLDSSDDENGQYGLMHRLFSSHDNTDSSLEEHTPKGSRSSSTRRIQVSCYEPGHGAHRQQGQQQQQQQQKPRELSPDQIQLVLKRLHRRQQMVHGTRYRQHAKEAKEMQAARKQRRAEQQQTEEKRRIAELQRQQRKAFNQQCGHLLQNLREPKAPVLPAVVALCDSLSPAQQQLVVRVPAPPPHKAEGPMSPGAAAARTAPRSPSSSSGGSTTTTITTSWGSSSSSSSKWSALSEEQEWALKQQAKQARLLQQQAQQQPSWYQPGARAYEQREARRQAAQAEEADRRMQCASSRSQQGGRSAVACLFTSLLPKNSSKPGPASTTSSPTPSASPPQSSPQRSYKAPQGKLRSVKEGQEAEWIAAEVLTEQRQQAAAEAQAAERERVLQEIKKWREAEQQAATEKQQAAEEARRQVQEEEQREIALHGSFKAAFRRSSKKLRTLVRLLSSK